VANAVVFDKNSIGQVIHSQKWFAIHLFVLRVAQHKFS
jgi:hypothetical protein